MSGRTLPAMIAAVVSDVDGTLVRTDKSLTERTVASVMKLRDAGIAFAIVSSRPPRGLKMPIERLGITTFVAGFNGGAIARPDLSIVASHFIAPDAATQAIAAIEHAGADAWVFAGQDWCVRDLNGLHVDLERRAVGFDPTIVSDFSSVAHAAAKIVAVSDDGALLARLQNDLRSALGADAEVSRSQTYYLDVTPPGHDKGTFVAAMEKRLGISSDAVATIGDMENDLPMFAKSGISFAMGNAADEIKRHATHVTDSNERDGFARAMETVLKLA